MTSAADIPAIIREATTILQFLEDSENRHRELLDQVHPNFRESARNLIHYLALRTFDLREIQGKLSSLAISSVGHSEGYTKNNIQNILKILHLLNGDPAPEDATVEPLNYFSSREQLRMNTIRAFGPCLRENCVKIMVTLPTEAAYDYPLCKRMLEAGMDIARINTSHDSRTEWELMISHIRKAEQETGRPCTIYMDLAGPKLRTGPIRTFREVKQDDDPSIKVYNGDWIQLFRENILGEPAMLDENGRIARPARISLTLPEVFDDLREGQQVSFDDGKIKSRIIKVAPDHVMVEVLNAGMDGASLKAEKGVNFPDTDLTLPPLTEEDEGVLPFMAAHADLVGYSFVRKPADVHYLQEALRKLGREDMGLILKIETREAFENLPDLLLAAMRGPKVGVMIARGDLAVEIGFERIAEVQEEILWISEAAHVPNIWATQVLEKLVRKGQATRAEITDAAMSARAECVMLNKGPYIAEAVSTLNDIIRRMSEHQFKRKSTLRPLQVAKKFLK